MKKTLEETAEKKEESDEDSLVKEELQEVDRTAAESALRSCLGSSSEEEKQDQDFSEDSDIQEVSE